MLLTEYLDTIQNTDQEHQFLQKQADLKEAFTPLISIPFVGKLFKALVAMGDATDIEEFKQSEHYASIQGYNIAVADLEKGYYSIHPGREMLTKMAILTGIIAAGLLVLCLCRKKRKGC